MISTITFAQKISAQWGDEIKLGHNFIIDSPLGIQNGNLFIKTLRPGGLFGSNHYGVATVNTKTLKLITSNEAEVATKKTKEIAMKLAKGKRWLFTRNTADKIEYIKGYPIDNSGKIVEKPVTIATFKDDKASFLIVNREAETNVILSPDSSKIAVVINANRKSKEKELYYIIVLDSDLKEQWSQTIEFPYTEKQFEQKALEVTNTGEIQIVGKLYDSEKAKESRSKTQAAYKYIIRTYSDKDKEGKEFVIDLGGKFVESSFIKTRPDNGNSVITGMYANKRSTGFFDFYSAVDGFYYLELKPDGSVANKYILEIDAANIKNITRSMLYKKENALTSNVKMIDLFFKKDGSLIVVTECSYITTSVDSKGRQTITYHNEDDIVFCLDPKGAVKWSISVPKLQASRSPLSLGAKCIFKNDNLFLVYNDSEKNLEKEPDGHPKGLGIFGKSVVTLALVNSDGKLSRKALTTKKELDGFLFSPYLSENIADDDFIFVSIKMDLFGGIKNKIARVKIGE